MSQSTKVWIVTHDPNSKSLPENEPEILKPQEIAATYRVSVMTVYRLLRSGKIPTIKIGKSIRVRASDWEDYVTREGV